jgi:hypothetical protein
MTVRTTEMNWTTKGMELTVEGNAATLYVKTESERIMSDVWEYVTRVYFWDGERVSSRVVDNTEHYKVEYTIDATEAVLREMEAKMGARFLEQEMAAADTRARKPEMDQIVRVVRGRQNLGTVGRVVVSKYMEYRAGYRTQMLLKYGIALDDAKGVYTAPNGRQYPRYLNMVWAWAHNVEVNQPVVDVALAQSRAQATLNEFMQGVRANLAKSLKEQAERAARADRRAATAA